MAMTWGEGWGRGAQSVVRWAKVEERFAERSGPTKPHLFEAVYLSRITQTKAESNVGMVASPSAMALLSLGLREERLL